MYGGPDFFARSSSANLSMFRNGAGPFSRQKSSSTMSSLQAFDWITRGNIVASFAKCDATFAISRLLKSLTKRVSASRTSCSSWLLDTGPARIKLAFIIAQAEALYKICICPIWNVTIGSTFPDTHYGIIIYVRYSSKLGFFRSPFG